MTLSGPGALLSQTPAGGGTAGANAGKAKISQGAHSNGAPSADVKHAITKVASEGGNKIMLDLILERLKYTIRSEWAEDQVVSKILETFKDVTIPRPHRLSDDEKEDDLMVEIWKESVKQHVSEVQALSRAKVKLYSTVWNLLSNKLLRNKVSGQQT